MDTLNEYLSSKLEHIATSLYNYSLRAKRSRNNNGYYDHDRDHGLKIIVHSEEENLHKRILHCCNMSKTKTTTPSQDSETHSSLWQRLSKSLWSSSPGSSAVQPTVMGDLIGTESGDYMSCDLIDELLGLGQSQSPRREFRVKKKREKVFPPAITLFRENNGGGMSSCFKKEYGEDGRLILKVGSMKSCYEYMEANRENGRLVMKLIHHDDDNDGWLDDNEDEEEEEKEKSCFDFEFENELVKEREGSEDESGGYCWADLRQCASYGSGGFAHDYESLYLGRYGSAPLRPITSVM